LESVVSKGKLSESVPVRLFGDQEAWAAWLEKNHAKSDGVWLRLAKKDSAQRSIGYCEALDIALCHGWIDGQKKSDTAQTWLQKFVPRSRRSIWSKINRGKALALIASGKMRPAGLEAIECAKKNGRWETAYDPPSRAQMPADLRAALDANPLAKAFFDALDGANRYAILFRIQTVKKPETRAKKIRQYVEMLEREETIHEPRKMRRSLM
jgi:uncharacterized protein YdeI (YjbR/CyaY-like superfamily)